MIEDILHRHALWLAGSPHGERLAVHSDLLRDEVLRGAVLARADLRDADMRGADLRGADLAGATLARADLRDADLRGADLRDADLALADLEGALLPEGYVLHPLRACYALAGPERLDVDGDSYRWVFWRKMWRTLCADIGLDDDDTAAVRRILEECNA
jgi:hypothetical protein